MQFRLVNITTEEFATIEDNFPNKVDDQIGLMLNESVGINPEGFTIGIFAKFQFLSKEKVFLILKVGCHFRIEEKDWDKMINTKHEILLEKELLTHFLAITVGTSRGILHEKKPKEFSNLLIPPLDISEVFKDDLKFSLPSETE